MPQVFAACIKQCDLDVLYTIAQRLTWGLSSHKLSDEAFYRSFGVALYKRLRQLGHGFAALSLLSAQEHSKLSDDIVLGRIGLFLALKDAQHDRVINLNKTFSCYASYHCMAQYYIKHYLKPEHADDPDRLAILAQRIYYNQYELSSFSEATLRTQSLLIYAKAAALGSADAARHLCLHYADYDEDLMVAWGELALRLEPTMTHDVFPQAFLDYLNRDDLSTIDVEAALGLCFYYRDIEDEVKKQTRRELAFSWAMRAKTWAAELSPEHLRAAEKRIPNSMRGVLVKQDHWRRPNIALTMLAHKNFNAYSARYFLQRPFGLRPWTLVMRALPKQKRMKHQPPGYHR